MEYTEGKLVISSGLLICDEKTRLVANLIPVVECPELSIGRDEAAANAEHLVKCWNSHDVLLAACENIMKKADAALQERGITRDSGIEHGGTLTEIGIMADAAIAAAQIEPDAK